METLDLWLWEIIMWLLLLLLMMLLLCLSRVKRWRIWLRRASWAKKQKAPRYTLYLLFLSHSH